MIGTRSQIYLSSIGAATLALELRDSETNAILARSIDRRAVEQQGIVQEVTSVTAISEVKRLMRRWGKDFMKGLMAGCCQTRLNNPDKRRHHFTKLLFTE